MLANVVCICLFCNAGETLRNEEMDTCSFCAASSLASNCTCVEKGEGEGEGERGEGEREKEPEERIQVHVCVRSCIPGVSKPPSPSSPSSPSSERADIVQPGGSHHYHRHYRYYHHYHHHLLFSSLALIVHDLRYQVCTLVSQHRRDYLSKYRIPPTPSP